MAKTPERRRTSRDKVRAHRERLRRQGLRPIEIWVPDVGSRRFTREARRQSRLVATSAFEGEEQRFIDAFAEWDGESRSSGER